MKLRKWITEQEENDIVKKGLAVPDPIFSKLHELDEKTVDEYISVLKKAVSAQEKKTGDDKLGNAILADLNDTLAKWKQAKKEGKSLFKSFVEPPEDIIVAKMDAEIAEKEKKKEKNK